MKRGYGQFLGNRLSQGLVGGTYELYFTPTTVRLVLYTNGEKVDEYNGSGNQTGLTNVGDGVASVARL